MKVLVAGGAGYIGSTICAVLRDNGHTPIILDSLVNGRKEFTKDDIFYEGDIADGERLKKIFNENENIDCVIHLAAFISVPESVSKPYKYYRENVEKALTFFNHLLKLGCKKIIFSSSASVYGNSETLQVTEESPVNPGSPYARTKVMVEHILEDFAVAYGMKVIALRYFNPIGADPKYRSGAYDKNPSHLLGVLLKAAESESKEMTVTGVDWPTKDGSGVRDYIHVWDLASAHVSAVEKIDTMPKMESDGSFEVINIGKGNGVTVKEFVAAFERVQEIQLDVKEGPPRDGDVAGAYAICDKAEKLLGWQASHSIEQAIRDAIIWEEKKKRILEP